MEFTQAIAMEPVGEGLFAWSVPDGWQQGRGAWGGLVAGGIVRALLAHEPDPERSLRSLTIQMFGPLPPGPARVRVSGLRIGSGMSTWAVDVVDADDQPVAHGAAITGGRRTTDLADELRSWGTATPPELPSWQEVEPVPAGIEGLPVFMDRLELRIAAGLPLSGPPARSAGYLRFPDQGAWDAEQLLGLVDAWYPTVLTALGSPRPLATVCFSAHLLVDPATLPPGEPLGFDSTLSAGADGYTSELRRLWAPDGRLAVENHQSIVVIR